MTKQYQDPGKLSRRQFITRAGAATGLLTLAANPVISAMKNSNSLPSGAPLEDPRRIMVGYIWGFGDLGGIAIVPGLLNLLYKHFPEYQMTTFGGNDQSRPYIREKFPECDVLTDDPYKGEATDDALARAKKDFEGELPPFTKETVDYVMETFAGYVIEATERANPDFLQALKESNLLIYPSGMMLNYGVIALSGLDFWGDTLHFALPLIVARKLGIPYGIYAQSFMAFEGPAAIYFIKNIMEDAAFVSCRDSSSVDYLKSMGINGPVQRPLPYHALPNYDGQVINAPHLRFVPDSTVSFGYRDDQWGKEFMQKYNLKSEEFLIVLPRTWPRPSTLTQLIGKERSNRHVIRLQSIITDWIRETGMKVLIASEVEKQRPNNKPQIYDPLPEDVKPYCEVQEEWWLSEQASAVFRHARMLAIMDFHSFYLAIPEGTPAVALMTRESGRKIWSCHDFKLPDYMFDIDMTPTETILQKLYSIHTNYEYESHRIQTEVIPHIRAIEEKQMQTIAEVLRA